MLKVVGYDSLDELMRTAVPDAIRDESPLGLPAVPQEHAALAALREKASRNRVLTSLIGRGYYGTHTPEVIRRNILENPAWYTAYTPYQPEISQGRLEALLNFQTVVADLTGMDIANASLLDEATAAAEAMTLARRRSKVGADTFVVDADCHPQVIEVVRTRAEPLGIGRRGRRRRDGRAGLRRAVAYPGAAAGPPAARRRGRRHRRVRLRTCWR